MKTTTYRVLVATLIVLQLIGLTVSGVSFARSKNGANLETVRLAGFANALLKFALVVTDYQIIYAGHDMAMPEDTYGPAKAEVLGRLDELENNATDDSEKLHHYQTQRKLFLRADRVVTAMLTAAANRANEDRLGTMVVVLTATRKLSELMHKSTDNLEWLCNRVAEPAAPPILPIAGGTIYSISLLLSIILIAKAPKSY